jgi:hypothetical protein
MVGDAVGVGAGVPVGDAVLYGVTGAMAAVVAAGVSSGVIDGVGKGVGVGDGDLGEYTGAVLAGTGEEDWRQPEEKARRTMTKETESARGTQHRFL